MSRTHLYRGNRAPRPIGAIVLASAWSGAALTALFTAPSAQAVGSLHGAAANLQDRMALIVALAAVLAGLVIFVGEVVVGRTVRRGLRLGGAVVLTLAGAVGAFDASRRTLRPGTPVLQAQTVAAAPPTALSDVGADARDEAGGERLVWMSVGLAGALLVLVGGVSALRAERAY